MRNATRNRFRFAVRALAAAWFVAWLGVPSARGDQTSNCTPNSIGNHFWDGSTGDHPWPIKSWPTTRPWPTNPCPTNPDPTNPCPTNPWPTNPSPTNPCAADNWASHMPCSRPCKDPDAPAPATDDDPIVQLSDAATPATTDLGSITLTGSNGSYVAQTITVTGAATTAGTLTVDGFDPTNDEEIYGLAATTNNLATLIAELNTAVAAADPGATAEAVPPSLASVLPGDNIAVIFPDNGVAPPNIFSYDLAGDTTDATLPPSPLCPSPRPSTQLFSARSGS